MTESRTIEITDKDGNRYEDQLKSIAEKKPAKEHRKRFNRKLLAVISIVILAVLMGVIGWFLLKKPSSPISQYQKNFNFELYYPSKLPDGYTLNEDSIVVNGENLFIVFENGSKKIRLSEQRIPDPRPTIENIEGNSSVKKIDNQYGNGFLGPSKGTPIGIFYTETTLINVSASSDVPIDEVNTVMTSLSN